MDIERGENGTLWTFNNHLLIIHRLKEDEDPMQIPLGIGGMKNFFKIRVQLDVRNPLKRKKKLIISSTRKGDVTGMGSFLVGTAEMGFHQK
ncbi:hypothetical protein Goshw_027418 [Gossypium schwendimanii]|uniref:Uncharacterized protein n=1 Tax=Gossypium schwendimanii TaxID=34291 RepID=A0A7J9MVL3_GOSSC|nr:hypothetical protein [Gossypium schwendimanii]